MVHATSKSKRIWMAIVTLALFATLILVVALTLPDFMENAAAVYETNIIEPEEAVLCPGERMWFNVTIERKRPGAVTLLENWCRVGGFCSIPSTIEQTSIIPYVEEPQTVRTHRSVPELHSMEPGDQWVFSRLNYPVGHEDDFEMYQVYITLADDCELWAE